MFPGLFIFLPFVLVALVVGFFFLLFFFALVQIGAISIAFAKLGLSGSQVFWILMATLLGSMVNIPVKKRFVSGQGVDEPVTLSWMWGHYRLAHPRQTDEQTIALNVGGAIVPCLLSFYFINAIGLSLGLVLSLFAVSLITFKLARPVPGVGIGIPFLLPPLVTVLAAWLFAPAGQTAQVAYVAGSLGTLIGADILHLANTRTMGSLQGASVLSIGGAGTFDGIFLAGIIAVLLA